MAVLIKNSSSQAGSYSINGKEHFLKPGQEVRTETHPQWASQELKVIVLDVTPAK